MKRTISTSFPEGTHTVLTMSYDDGQIHDRRLISIFNKYGIKGTFHLNSGFMGVREDGRDDDRRINADEVRTLYAGHEVSCHTVFHPTIARCPITQVVRQVIEDREALEGMCGYPVRGMSYPNGSYNQEIIDALPACGIEYSRVVGDTHDFAFPENYLAWKATCHHSRNLMENAKRFTELNKRQYLYMMYVWGHSYEFERGDEFNSWEHIENFCRYIGGRDDIWYATNIEIVDYMNAAHNLKFTAAGDMVYNPNAIPVWITVDVPDNNIKIEPGTTVNI